MLLGGATIALRLVWND